MQIIFSKLKCRASITYIFAVVKLLLHIAMTTSAVIHPHRGTIIESEVGIFCSETQLISMNILLSCKERIPATWVIIPDKIWNPTQFLAK